MSDTNEIQENGTTVSQDSGLEELCKESNGEQKSSPFNESFIGDLKLEVKRMMELMTNSSLFKKTDVTDEKQVETSAVAGIEDGSQNSPDNDEPKNESNVEPEKSDFKLDSAFDEVFGLVQTLFTDTIKHRDKPYLAHSMMLTFFKTLSLMQTAGPDNADNLGSDPEYNQYVEIIRTNSIKICDMMKDSTIEDLCDVPEFKTYVLATTLNYNKLLIFGAKKGIEKMEAELSEFNDTTSIDTLLENLYSKLSKK